MGSEETSRMRLPLEDVTVIDLSHALAGPFCSTMLADFGARVIKLEPNGAGDIARARDTPLPGGETAYFVSLHRNKQGTSRWISSTREAESSEHTAEVRPARSARHESGGRVRLARPGLIGRPA